MSPAFIHVAKGLDEKERIATGDGGQRPGQLFIVVAGFGDVSGDIVFVQTAQRKAIGGAEPGTAMQVSQHRSQWMCTVEVGAAVGADDLHAGVLAEAQEMPQQQKTRHGCPVQVVENKNHRRGRRRDPQHRDHGVEQCVAITVRVDPGP